MIATHVDWDVLIPKGEVTLLMGAGASGKTSIAIDLGARATTSKAPWQTEKRLYRPQGFVYVTSDMSYEQAEERFRHANGNPEFFELFPATVELRRVEKYLVNQRDYTFLVLDGVLTPEQGHKETVYLMEQLRHIAWLLDIRVLVTMTVHKVPASSAGGIYGSIMATNLARSVLMLGTPPDSASHLTQVKSKSAKLSDSLGYRIRHNGTVDWRP